MTDPSDGNTTPPNLLAYFATDEHTTFSRTVPTESKLYSCFFNKNHTVKRQFVTVTVNPTDNTTTTDTQLTFYEADGTTILPEFLDEAGQFDPVMRNDGTFIMNGTTDTTPTPVDKKNDINLDMMTILTKAKAREGMPTLYKWDANPATWYSWKKTAEGRWRRMSIMPPTTTDSFKLSDTDDLSLYDECFDHIKKDGNSAHCRNILCLLADADKSGTKL